MINNAEVCMHHAYFIVGQPFWAPPKKVTAMGQPSRGFPKRLPVQQIEVIDPPSVQQPCVPLHPSPLLSS